MAHVAGRMVWQALLRAAVKIRNESEQAPTRAKRGDWTFFFKSPSRPKKRGNWTFTVDAGQAYHISSKPYLSVSTSNQVVPWNVKKYHAISINNFVTGNKDKKFEAADKAGFQWNGIRVIFGANWIWQIVATLSLIQTSTVIFVFTTHRLYLWFQKICSWYRFIIIFI